jgi:bacterial/archaeal transporter family protein
MHWMVYAGVAIVLWGVCGIFMKLGTNRISARSMVIWVTVGFLFLVPLMWEFTSLVGLSLRVIIIGLMGGVMNGLGNWAVFMCLEKGAKASVATPLTALYPLFTVLLATVLLAERPTPLQWLGIVIALGAGAMLSYEPPAISSPLEEQSPCVR